MVDLQATTAQRLLKRSAPYPASSLTPAVGIGDDADYGSNSTLSAQSLDKAARFMLKLRA